MNKTVSLIITNPTAEAEFLLREKIDVIAELLAEALVSKEFYLGELLTIEAKVSVGDEMNLVSSKPFPVDKPKVYKNQYSDVADAKKDKRGVTTWTPKEETRE